MFQETNTHHTLCYCFTLHFHIEQKQQQWSFKSTTPGSEFPCSTPDTRSSSSPFSDCFHSFTVSWVWPGRRKYCFPCCWYNCKLWNCKHFLCAGNIYNQTLVVYMFTIRIFFALLLHIKIRTHHMPAKQIL